MLYHPLQARVVSFVWLVIYPFRCDGVHIAHVFLFFSSVFVLRCEDLHRFFFLIINSIPLPIIAASILQYLEAKYILGWSPLVCNLKTSVLPKLKGVTGDMGCTCDVKRADRYASFAIRVEVVAHTFEVNCTSEVLHGTNVC